MKKRKKTSRIRGARTCGWGFRQKHKGHGNKGGVGMSGSGKRGDQKKQKVLMNVKGKYFGKKGFTSRRSAKKENKVLNLQDIKENYFTKEGDKIELKNYKILGKGEGFKAVIVCKGASKGAVEKMGGAGGGIEVYGDKKKGKDKKVYLEKD